MKDIVELRVSQVRIYPIDALPFSALFVEKNLKAFKERLRFKSASLGEEKKEISGLLFQNGEFKHGGNIHIIEQLQIERQRIMFVIAASSVVADALYEEIRKIIITAEAKGVFAKVKPLVKTEETVCVATLNVEFREIFAPSLLRYFEKIAQDLTSVEFATSEVVPSSFSAKVSYEITDADLKGKFQLVDKILIIEPRVGTRLEERRYFTHSPTDSNTHLSLLREFEKALGSSREISASPRKKKR